MKDSEVYAEVVKWLSLTAGIVFIQAHQSGTRPAEPYGMVNMTGYREVRSNPQGVDWLKLPDNEQGEGQGSIATPLIETEWQFSIHIYGENASDFFRPIRSAFHLLPANAPLTPNLIIFEISQVRKVPEWVNEKWEDRAQMDFMVRGLTRDGIRQDTIETTSISIDLERLT